MQSIIWNDDPNDPDANLPHIWEHELTKSDVEWVLENPESESVSRESGRPCVFGYTPDGEYIIVIYEQIDEGTVYPITAYPVPEPA